MEMKTLIATGRSDSLRSAYVFLRLLGYHLLERAFSGRIKTSPPPAVSKHPFPIFMKTTWAPISLLILSSLAATAQTKPGSVADTKFTITDRDQPV